jgi:hypothetical protein
VSFCENAKRQPNPLPPYSKDLGTHTLAVAVLEITNDYLRRKEDAKFEAAFAELD